MLITGANRGLGFTLAEKSLQAGCRVFAGAQQLGEGLASLRARFPEKLAVVSLDVTSMASVRQAAHEVSEKVGSLDVLINNAGVHLEDKHTPLEELDLEDQHLQKSMEVNAFGPLRVTREFLPLLEKGDRKLIMNISSEAGSIGDCWRKQEFAYCMSKAALNMQTKILQNCLEPRGFKLLAVHPGWMRTDMGGQDADIDPSEAAEGILSLALKQWASNELQSDGPGDGIYLDYQGNRLRW